MTAPFLKTPLTVNIDHHVSNHRFARINWVDPKASAVGEMIYRLYRAFRLRPTRDEAFCLYVAIVTDTGSFRYLSTTPAVHRIAAELIALGVSPLKTAQHLYECHSPKDMQFLGAVLRNLRSTPDHRVAWLEIPQDLLRKFRPGPEILDELVNYPRAVRAAEVAFVLKQRTGGGEIRVSFRSKGRVDVNRIACGFGGGGHRAASGCTLQGTLPRVRKQVLNVVRQAVAHVR
jgi:bifunctional oligoribonuclease and PAP phosphatase NrnA